MVLGQELGLSLRQVKTRIVPRTGLRIGFRTGLKIGLWTGHDLALSLGQDRTYDWIWDRISQATWWDWGVELSMFIFTWWCCRCLSKAFELYVTLSNIGVIYRSWSPTCQGRNSSDSSVYENTVQV